MSQDGNQIQDRKRRVIENEPIIEPMAMEGLLDADLPFRGPLRQEVLEGVLQQVRARRTLQGISSRVASQAVAPVTNVLESRAQDRLTQRIEASARKSLGDNSQNVETPDIGPGILRGNNNE